MKLINLKKFIHLPEIVCIVGSLRTVARKSLLCHKISDNQIQESSSKRIPLYKLPVRKSLLYKNETRSFLGKSAFSIIGEASWSRMRINLRETRDYSDFFTIDWKPHIKSASRFFRTLPTEEHSDFIYVSGNPTINKSGSPLVVWHGD